MLIEELNELKAKNLELTKFSEIKEKNEEKVMSEKVILMKKIQELQLIEQEQKKYIHKLELMNFELEKGILPGEQTRLDGIQKKYELNSEELQRKIATLSELLTEANNKLKDFEDLKSISNDLILNAEISKKLIEQKDKHISEIEKKFKIEPSMSSNEKKNQEYLLSDVPRLEQLSKILKNTENKIRKSNTIV